MHTRRLTSIVRSTWRDHPVDVRPTVLLLGGFLTAPPMYRRFVARLVERGAAGVVVSSVWTPDWMIATSRGSAAITNRAGRALIEARALAAGASDGAPLLVIGHSAGGLIARLLTVAEPFPGRRFGATRDIGAIVTLGAPHVVSQTRGVGGRLYEIASGIAEQHVPGAAFAPQIGYVSVASSSATADPTGNGRERVAYLLYRSILGRQAGAGMAGDSLVPVESALLPGATPVVLEGITHGPGSGRPWYGSEEAVDVWWPVALAAWRSAILLRARPAPGVTAPGRGREDDLGHDRLEAAG